MRQRWRVAAAGAVMAMAAGPAAALAFNFTVASGATLSADQAAAFTQAGAMWASYLADPITVNLQVGFSSLGSNVLGSTSLDFVTLSGARATSLLTADRRSADDYTAVASLPTTPQTTLLLTSAQARAIGAATNVSSDATILFSSDYSFSTSRDANGGTAAGTYDLIGVAAHEIGHALGFVSSIDGSLNYQTILDQYRYSAAGVRSVAAGASAYFSINGGSTDIAGFSPGGSGNYQASHWDQSISALMMPAFSPGTTQNITALDVQALDVIGYDRIAVATAQVPEPATWATTVLGFGAIGAAWRRRRRPSFANVPDPDQRDSPPFAAAC